jgi:hypothetical protein
MHRDKGHCKVKPRIFVLGLVHRQFVPSLRMQCISRRQARYNERWNEVTCFPHRFLESAVRLLVLRVLDYT